MLNKKGNSALTGLGTISLIIIILGVIISFSTLNLTFTDGLTIILSLVVFYFILLVFLSLVLKPKRQVKKSISNDEKYILENYNDIIKNGVSVLEEETPVFEEKEEKKKTQRSGQRSTSRTTKKKTSGSKEDTKNSKFIGSITSKIYHPADSRFAKFIKPKNRFYSNSEAELKKAGFKPSKRW